MVKRGRLEIIYDILKIIKNNNNGIKPTPLIRKSNLSSSRFKEYYLEMIEKDFIVEKSIQGEKKVFVSERGLVFLDKYKVISGFVEEFGL